MRGFEEITEVKKEVTEDDIVLRLDKLLDKIDVLIKALTGEGEIKTEETETIENGGENE